MVDVLVVGAGPVGLTLSWRLRRLGVDLHLVDAAEAPGTESRALAVQARTLELLGPDVAGELLHAGTVIRRVELLDDRGLLGVLDLTEAPTAYPHVLAISQTLVEGVVTRALVDAGGSVERGWRQVGLRQIENSVEATLRDARGTNRVVHAQYVVGCDGASSAVRSFTRLDGRARRDRRWWMLADVRLDGPALPPIHTARIVARAGELVASFPLTDDGRNRRLVVAPRGSGERPDVTAEAVQRAVDRITGTGTRVVSAQWLSAFRIREHVARRFRAGRVLLAGDAAHTHSPLGGQGMNLGMHDAMELAPLLERVLRERGAERILTRYARRRRAIARRTVAMTGAGTRMMLARSRVVVSFRRAVMTSLLRRRWVQQRAARTLLMLGARLLP